MFKSLKSLFQTSPLSINIQLNQPIYYTGEFIEGCVTVAVYGSPFRFDRLVLNLYGIESVDLHEGSGNTTIQVPVDEQTKYHERKIFYDELVLKTDSGQFKERSLPVGTTTFNFRCVLGSTAPGSLAFVTNRGNGKASGRIHYEFIADLTSPGLFTFLQRFGKTAFEYRQLPLMACTPAQVIAELPMGTPWIRYLLCMHTDDENVVEVMLSLNRSYYVLNERVHARLRIFNKSLRDISDCTVCLRRQVRLMAMARTVLDEEIITKVRVGRISAGESVERRCVLSTPNNSPFTTKGQLVSCHYELVTKMQPSWSFFKMQHIHPIEIYDLKLPQYVEATAIQMSTIK